MKWLAFIMTLLAFCAFSRVLHAKEPRTLTLTESDVAPVRTAIGYTTMLNFDARPSSVILGDQDAFKVEYVGNGLAIKPVVAHAKTNLFVFTDYDRFSFRLTAGPTAEADYMIRVKNKRSESYSTGGSGEESAKPQSSALIERRINRKTACAGFQLAVESIAWPKSQSTYLITLRVTLVRPGVKSEDLPFEPGDFEVSQGSKSLAIENLYLQRLIFSKQTRSIRGTIVIRQTEIERGKPITLTFAPDFLKKQGRCLSVAFKRKS
jgi:hypothetical protein